MSATPNDSPETSPAPAIPPTLRIITALWQGRLIIAGCAATAALVAAMVAWTLPETYESEAALILLPSAVKQSGSEMTELMARGLSVADYEILLTSDGILLNAAEKIRAAGQWPEDDIEQLFEISNLRKRMIIEVKITQKTAYGSSHSPVIQLKARAALPDQARDLAQAWAEVAEELSSELARQGKSGSIEFLNEKFSHAHEELDRVYSAMRDFEIEFNDELEGARLQNMHGRLLAYEEKLIDLRMQRESLLSEVALLREKLANEPERRVLWQSAPMSSVFLEEAMARGAKPRLSDEQRKAGYEAEVINPLWEHLRDKLSGKEIELNGVEEHLRQLESTVDTLAGELDAQREMVARKQFDYRQLSLKLAPRKTSYDQLSVKLEQAKIAEAEEEKLSDIKSIAAPIVPDRRVRPMRSLIVAAAGLAGLVIGAAGVAIRSEADRLRALGALS